LRLSGQDPGSENSKEKVDIVRCDKIEIHRGKSIKQLIVHGVVGQLSEITRQDHIKIVEIKPEKNSQRKEKVAGKTGMAEKGKQLRCPIFHSFTSMLSKSIILVRSSSE
jgi:hypothetical protein